MHGVSSYGYVGDQENVYDLLNKSNRKKMQVKEGENGFYVKDLTMYGVKCSVFARSALTLVGQSKTGCHVRAFVRSFVRIFSDF